MRSPFVSCWKECGRRGIRVVWQMLLAPELSCSAPARLEGEAAPPVYRQSMHGDTHTPLSACTFSEGWRGKSSL